MPTAIAQGRTFNFPEGTTPEQMGLAIDEYFQSVSSPEPLPDDQVRTFGELQDMGVGRRSFSEPSPLAQEFNQALEKSAAKTQDYIQRGGFDERYSGLPFESALKVKKQIQRGGPDDAQRLINLEKIRLDNPELAQLIEGMSAGETALVGAGKFTDDVIEGAQRLVGVLDQEDALESEEYYQALESARPAASRGYTGAAVGSLVVPGSKAAQIGSTPLRIGAEAMVGGAAGGIPSLGQGDDPGEAAKKAAVGAGLSVIAGEAFNYPRLSPKQRELKQILQESPDDAKVAGYVLRGGRPEKLQAAQAALKQNVDPRFVGLVKEASKPDRAKFKNMVQILKRGRENLKAAKDARPTDVLGRSLADRFKTIKTMNKQAGQKIDDIARSQLKGKNVDLVDPISQFRRDLAEKLRVTYDPRTGSLNFEGSALTGKNAAGARAAIKDISRRLRNPQMDANDAHFLKRVIDNQTTFGKSTGGLSGDAESIIKDLRRNINESIRDISPSYKNANIKYSDTITDIENFKKAVGPSIDINAPNAEKAIGTVFRGLDSNNKSRIALENSAFNLQETAKKYGVTFKDDIKTQAIMANALEERFGSFSGTSFQGGIERAGARLLDPSASNFQKGAAVVNYGKEKIKGVTDEKAIDALLRLSE